jgi:hypothetical protein
LANHFWIAAEFTLPQAVAEHHHLAAVGRILLRREGTAEHDRSAEEAEVSFRHVDAVDLLRPVAGDVEAGTGEVVRGNLLEDIRLLLPVVEFCDGRSIIVAIGIAVEEL